MASFRVSVTYTVDVVDRDALLQAGAAAWQASAGGWAVTVEECRRGGAATAEEADAVGPGEEASVAFVLGQQEYPLVPGVRFTGVSVDVTEHTPDAAGDRS